MKLKPILLILLFYGSFIVVEYKVSLLTKVSIIDYIVFFIVISLVWGGIFAGYMDITQDKSQILTNAIKYHKNTYNFLKQFLKDTFT